MISQENTFPIGIRILQFTYFSRSYIFVGTVEKISELSHIFQINFTACANWPKNFITHENNKLK